jgi:hypothetical protein
LCSLHVTKGQLDRDPEKLNENGYEGARICLRKDAVPDIPLAIQKSKDDNSAISIFYECGVVCDAFQVKQFTAGISTQQTHSVLVLVA